MSASGPRTLELAGRTADGVILLVGLFPGGPSPWALEHIDGGAAAGPARTGRRRPPCGRVRLRRHRRSTAGPPWPRALSIAALVPERRRLTDELAGLSDDLVARDRLPDGGGEFQEAAEAASLLPDDFVRKVALAGDAADARSRIEAVLAAGADSVHVFPLGEGRMGTVRAFAEVLGRGDRPALAPGRTVWKIRYPDQGVSP